MSFKRGFLNTPRSKRVINEAYTDAPQPPLSDSKRPKSAEVVTVANNAMNVDVTAIDNVSDAGSHAAQSTEAEATLPSAHDDETKNAAPSSKGKDPKGKGKAKEVDAEKDPLAPYTCMTHPPRPRPHRAGWGRHPDEEYFHTVPESHGGPHKRRAVFRYWPRDPKGQILKPSGKPRGKFSPDGYPWAETLFDIYSTNRFADGSYRAVTIMTGSALVEAMKEMGELGTARSEIEWTLTEGEPMIEAVASTAELIKTFDRRVPLLGNQYSMRDELREKASREWVNSEDVELASEEEKSEKDVAGAARKDDSGDVKMNSDEDYGGDDKDQDEDDPKVDPASIPPPPIIPTTSPFHPSYYPAPWPFIPVENPLSVVLQERVPLYLLPKTLYVHDPFNLLSARDPEFRDTSWKSRPDIIRTYNLNFSSSVRKEVKEAQRKAEELEEFKARTLIILRYKRTKERIKNHEPMIEVPLPPYPRCLTKVEESHLYISPVCKIGDGHHSIVYKGEWELPRDLFIRPKLCRLCFKDTVDKEIQRLKDTGRWQKMLNVVSGCGQTGSTGRGPTKEELDEVNDPPDLARDGEIIERELTCVVPPDMSPTQIIEMVEGSNVWDELMKNKKVNAARLDFTEAGDDEDTSTKAIFPLIRVDAPVAYDRYKTCKHGVAPFTVPRTARFTVVAKLSLEDDYHLEREAENYQRFPGHFFHHYNGYTIIQQLHAVVPVGAVVPQFYGYYTLGEDQRSESYLSPILLLEHCGEPIEPEELSVEDQEECASLLLRFQRTGWLHESIAPRNFLVQRGKPTEFPITRDRQPDLSFRLIDFGRSKRYTTAGEKQREEKVALRMMFSRLRLSMNVTLSL